MTHEELCRLEQPELVKMIDEGKLIYNEFKEDIEKIVDFYGGDKQLRQLQEECAELIVAINKRLRYGSTKAFVNLIEELADVEIMVEQIKYYYRIKDNVNDVKYGKINRQFDRMRRC